MVAGHLPPKPTSNCWMMEPFAVPAQRQDIGTGHVYHPGAAGIAETGVPLTRSMLSWGTARYRWSYLGGP